MSKRQYWAVLDSETTVKDTIADLAIVICDREGRIYNQCAVLVAGHYGTHELFHDKNANDIWGYQGLIKRQDAYKKMLDDGHRTLASVNAINKWINQAIGKYNPELTAYNLAFDKDKCKKTGIDLSGFTQSFCLWGASVGNICNTKNFRKFVLENHAFNNVTINRNMTLQTNAEIVAGFVKGNYQKEEHTALSDVVDFEIPILCNILKKRGWREKITPYVWKNHQVKDYFVSK